MIFSSTKKKQLALNILLPTCAFVIFLFFGIKHLESFVTADEHYWVYERIPKYWDALNNNRIEKTYINDKPGITVALVSSFGLLSNNLNGYILDSNDGITRYNVNKTSQLFQSFRIPILVFASFSSFLFYFLIYSITKKKLTSFLSCLFIFTSPILIGMSQIVNPDALLWIFFNFSILSLLAYLQSRKKFFAVLTSVMFGFSLLTKYTATIFFPFSSLMIIAYVIWNHKNNIEAENLSTSIKSVFYLIRSHVFMILGALAMFAIFMPAVFIKPNLFWLGTLGFSGIGLAFWPLFALEFYLAYDSFKNNGRFLEALKRYLSLILPLTLKIFAFILPIIVLLELLNWNSNESIMHLSQYAFDSKYEVFEKLYVPIFGKILLEFMPLTFSLTPIVLFGAMIAWIYTLFKKSEYYFIIWTYSLFILIFYLAMLSKDLQATVRYGIVLYPIFSVLAALGFGIIFSKLKRLPIKITFIIAIISLNIFHLSSAYPFYLNYTNDLLPKNFIINDAWGYGGYEAAQIINSLPNSQNLTVWSDYYGVCEFIKGTCITQYVVNPEKNKIDYFVLTRRGEIRYKFDLKHKKKPHNFIRIAEYYDNKEPYWSLVIGDRAANFISIYKATD